MSNVTGIPIWRDGDRLVSEDCGGFVDTVPDENLERYAADESSHELARAFAAAVLSIRQYERALADDKYRRLAGRSV